MAQTLIRANTRGFVNEAWLKSHHSFSFDQYYNSERMRFGMLRVLNDDTIAPAEGFDTHPHANMEIVTIPLSGSLRHKDSMGHEQVITAGEVQRMSAGTGITHSEYNHSKTEPVTLLQIWIFPKVKDIAPSYAQKRFDPAGRKNKFQMVVAPQEQLNSENGPIGINQDAYFSLVDLAVTARFW